jgi:AcrR family transcriptional regulator
MSLSPQDIPAVVFPEDPLAAMQDPAQLTTHDKLLNAAELLLAERGYFGVSLRQVASKAKLDLAMIHYHFGRKDDLFKAVLKRRGNVMNLARTKALKALPADASARDVVQAILFPVLKFGFHKDPGWLAYAQIIAQLTTTPHWWALTDEVFGTVGKLTMQKIQLHIPQLDEEHAATAYLFVLGALTLAFAQGRDMRHITAHAPDPQNFEMMYKSLVDFATGGVLALTPRS